MIVSHRHRMGFIHIPKTAGTSIRHWLLEGPHGFEPLEGQGPHDTLWQLRDPALRRYQWFAVHRDPYQRLWSEHQYHLRTRGEFCGCPLSELARGFDRYCRRWWGRRPQVLWVDRHTHMLSYHHLIRDFAWVQQRLADTRPLPYHNRGTAPAPLYTAGLLEWLAPLMRPDCVRWGYAAPRV